MSQIHIKSPLQLIFEFSIHIAVATIAFSRVKQACDPPENNWSPPPTDSRNSREVTSVWPAGGNKIFDGRKME
ncbi:hypothetical protein EVAR_94686_1 [Eumeta japonica]|uniref:Uncharacterized protein n=1 Tax=Eumeta variegata TaxID=151549 RepID=A0A4C1UWW9_EUMVA|nr:hypothetical protein EVAR_94686_1 [Eumeta japonica]